MNTQQKISFGSVLTSFAGAAIVLSSILDWVALDRPWGFLLGFLLGLAAGVGVVLVISGLLENRHSD